LQNYHNTFVIFDFDKTISKYDSYIMFLLFALRNRPWRIFFCLHLPIMVLAFALGMLSNSRLKGIFLKAILGGLQKKALINFSELFVNRLYSSGLRADALKTIKEYQAQGHYMILASASFDFYLVPLAHKLHFDEVICTKAEWLEGRLSGRICGENCHGEAKRNAIISFLSEKETAKYLITYTDHYSDLPLLLMSDESYLVNPDRVTLAKLASYDFHVVNWR
jgi:HAD superfamily hydrolase (TIGR01490 family)